MKAGKDDTKLCCKAGTKENQCTVSEENQKTMFAGEKSVKCKPPPSFDGGESLLQEQEVF